MLGAPALATALFAPLGLSSPAAASASTRVTFVGFQQFEDKSSRLFVHLTAEPASIARHADGVRVRFTFADTDVGVRNNKNPLVLKHFKAPLLRARLTQVDTAVQLELVLRKPIAVSHRVMRRDDGLYSLEIDFAAP
jgi:hypothetical protein